MSKFVFINDICSADSNDFQSRLVTRYKAKLYDVQVFDLIKEVNNFYKLLHKTLQYTQELHTLYLSAFNSFILNHLTEQNNKIYILRGTPFVYKSHTKLITSEDADVDSNSTLLLNKFKKLVVNNFNYVYVTSYSEFIKDRLVQKDDYGKAIYQAILQKTIAQSTDSEKLQAIQTLKSQQEQLFMELRKMGMNCIKVNVNFNEDITSSLNTIVLRTT